MTKGRYARQDKMIREKRHDVYRKTGKAPESTYCAGCGAVFVDGRWAWGDVPAGGRKATCPACRRTADRLPAGTIELKGEFFAKNREEILNLVRNVETQHKGEHPLERIMEIVNGRGSTVVTTTGIHVARRIGEALTRSYKGNFNFQYGDGEKSIRVFWER